ncbi:MAG: hypothetical protein Q8P81_03700 [Nanoarchaeota archaeon]|nr:hypothetical protein [Nanoarchaeota archaeon]
MTKEQVRILAECLSRLPSKVLLDFVRDICDNDTSLTIEPFGVISKFCKNEKFKQACLEAIDKSRENKGK